MEILDDISYFVSNVTGDKSDNDYFSTDKNIIHNDSQDETMQKYRDEAKDKAANPPQFDFYEHMDRSQFDLGYADSYAD